MFFRFDEDEDVTIKVLKSFKEKDFSKIPKEDLGLFSGIDLETTGLDHKKNGITEIGISLFKYNNKTGEIYKMERSYGSLNDCGIPIPQEVTDLTGLTDEKVKGQKIDWDLIKKYFKISDFVIAHNAIFDRAYIEDVEEIKEVSFETIWCCSKAQVDWKKEGYDVAKQTCISADHGFKVRAHRAENDVLAMATNLRFKSKKSGVYFLKMVLDDYQRDVVEVMAFSAPFEKKETLKSEGFQWNPGGKVWSKTVAIEELEDYKTFLKREVYEGSTSFKNLVVNEIPRNRRFI